MRTLLTNTPKLTETLVEKVLLYTQVQSHKQQVKVHGKCQFNFENFSITPHT